MNDTSGTNTMIGDQRLVPISQFEVIYTLAADTGAECNVSGSRLSVLHTNPRESRAMVAGGSR